MKRLFKNVLLVLLLTLGFVFGSLDVYAEEASSDASRWTVPPIEKLTTSDGIDIVPDTSNMVIDPMWGDLDGELLLTVIIQINLLYFLDFLLNDHILYHQILLSLSLLHP